MSYRSIANQRELNELDEDSVIMSADLWVEDGPGYRIPSQIAQRVDDENWYVIGSEMPITADELVYPVIVLWEPTP